MANRFDRVLSTIDTIMDTLDILRVKEDTELNRAVRKVLENAVDVLLETADWECRRVVGDVDIDDILNGDFDDDYMSNIQLAYMLQHGYGEALYDGVRYTSWVYHDKKSTKPVPEGLKVASWNGDFTEPTESFYVDFLKWLNERSK